MQDRSRPVSSSASVIGWETRPDETGLDFGDQSWICNAALVWVSSTPSSQKMDQAHSIAAGGRGAHGATRPETVKISSSCKCSYDISTLCRTLPMSTLTSCYICMIRKTRKWKDKPSRTTGEDGGLYEMCRSNERGHMQLSHVESIIIPQSWSRRSQKQAGLRNPTIANDKTDAVRTSFELLGHKKWKKHQ